MKLLITAPAILMLLSACGPALSNSSALGLSVIKYDDELQNTAANEFALNQCPALNQFMKDYLVLRDQVRVK